MNKLSLKPVNLLGMAAAAAALLFCAGWTAYTGSEATRPLVHASVQPAPWHASHEYSVHHHLGSMSEAERAAMIRLQLATASGRWFP